MSIPHEHRTKLDALAERRWRVRGRGLYDGDELEAFYVAIRKGQAPDLIKDRKWDRAVTILKRAGLVVYDRQAGWRCTDQESS